MRREAALFAAVLVCGILLFSPIPGLNEFDSAVSARHFASPDWISGDWYLDQAIPYRLLFNTIAGLAARAFGLVPAIILGRLLCLALFALGLAKIGSMLRLKWPALFLAMFYFFQNQSLFAREWMVGGFEAKAVAYAFLILALAFAMESKLQRAAVFAGLAVSMHVLVGLYGSFCIAVAVLSLQRDKLKPSTGFYSMLLFAISGSFGIFAAAGEALSASPPELSRLAAEVYVRFRVAHHVLPSQFANHLWLPAVALVSASLAGFFVWVKDKNLRFLLTVAFSAVSLIAIGAIVYFAGLHHLLKFYWFRLPDSFLPLTIVLSASYLLSRLMESGRSKWALWAVVGTAIVVFGFGIFTFVCKIKEHSDLGSQRLARVEPELFEALDWISKNTPEGSQFLASPTIEEFYYLAERPLFVSLKHSPQTDEHIVEWFERVKLCAGGIEPPEGGVFAYREWMEERFYHLSEKQISDILGKYSIDFILFKGKLPFEPVYSNKMFKIYKIH